MSEMREHWQASKVRALGIIVGGHPARKTAAAEKRWGKAKAARKRRRFQTTNCSLFSLPVVGSGMLFVRSDPLRFIHRTNTSIRLFVLCAGSRERVCLMYIPVSSPRFYFFEERTFGAEHAYSGFLPLTSFKACDVVVGPILS